MPRTKMKWEPTRVAFERWGDVVEGVVEGGARRTDDDPDRVLADVMARTAWKHSIPCHVVPMPGRVVEDVVVVVTRTPAGRWCVLAVDADLCAVVKKS